MYMPIDRHCEEPVQFGEGCSGDGVQIERLLKSFCMTIFCFASFFQINGKKQVNIHPSSALFQYKPSCVIYNELVQTSKCYIRDLCVVDQEWLTDLAPADFKSIHLKPVVQHEIPLTVSQLLNHHEKRKRWTKLKNLQPDEMLVYLEWIGR